MPFSAADLPDLTGRVFVVTGANSGIGLDATRMLASRGATVVMACRSPQRANAAVDGVKQAVPGAKLELLQLDLADLASVRRAAAELAQRFPKVDVLVNNAGIMAIPRTTTADGFEMQLGTNHFGHFAFTGLVLPLLVASGDGRVVTVSSNAHKMGKLDFADLMSEKGYHKWWQYGRSKLANLVFHHELARRLAAAGLPVRSAACHPGYSATNLASVGPEMEGSAFGAWLVGVGNRAIAMPSEQGALPTIYAAAMPDVRNGDYFGPDGFLAFWGYPKKEQPNALSRDAASMKRLWEESVRLTGVTYDALPADA